MLYTTASLDIIVAYKTYQKAFVAYKTQKDILRAPVDERNVTLITGRQGVINTDG